MSSSKNRNPLACHSKYNLRKRPRSNTREEEMSEETNPMEEAFKLAVPQSPDDEEENSAADVSSHFNPESEDMDEVEVEPNRSEPETTVELERRVTRAQSRNSGAVMMPLERGAEIADELDSEKEGSDESSEQSSFDDLDESDDEDLIHSPKAGPSKGPTRRAQKAIKNKKREDGSNRKASKKDPFTCIKCGKSYDNQSSLTVHLSYDCGKEPSFECDLCKNKFKRKSHLQDHLTKVHAIDRKHLGQYGAGLKEFQQETPFKCAKCGKYFQQKRTLDKHVKEECGVSFQCNLCQQSYEKLTSLRRHLCDVHEIADHKLDSYGAGLKDRTTGKYKCGKCGRTYGRKDHLDRHSKNECDGEKHFKCPQCEVRFTQKSYIRRHLSEHHPTFELGPVVQSIDKKNKCDRCGKSFTRKYNLESHAGKCGK